MYKIQEIYERTILINKSAQSLNLKQQYIKNNYLYIYQQLTIRQLKFKKDAIYNSIKN